MTADQEHPTMQGDEHNPAPGEAGGLRSMRESMRASSDLLKVAAIAHDDQADVDIARLYRIQDLQAEVFRLREARKDAVRHADENFYRVLDLQDDVRGLEEEIRGLQEEIRGLQEEAHGLQEEVRGLQEEVRGLQEDVRGLQEEVGGLQAQVRDQDARINALVSELDASHAREAAQQAQHHAIALTTSAELAQWQAYAAGLRGVVGDILSSDSWRFTWVLRAVSATLRGRKSTGPALPDAPPTRGTGHDGG